MTVFSHVAFLFSFSALCGRRWFCLALLFPFVSLLQFAPLRISPRSPDLALFLIQNTLQVVRLLNPPTPHVHVHFLSGKLCTPKDPYFEGFRYPCNISYCTRHVTVALKRTVAAYYGLFSLLHELVDAVSIWSIAALRMVCANIFDCHVQVYQKQTGRCMNLTTGILSVSEDATTKQTCGPRFQSLIRA